MSSSTKYVYIRYYTFNGAMESDEAGGYLIGEDAFDSSDLRDSAFGIDDTKTFFVTIDDDKRVRHSVNGKKKCALFAVCFGTGILEMPSSQHAKANFDAKGRMPSHKDMRKVLKVAKNIQKSKPKRMERYEFDKYEERIVHEVHIGEYDGYLGAFY